MSVVRVILAYVVTTTSELTVPPEAVYVFLCCVFLAELGLIPFNLELTFTFHSLQSVRTSRTHSLTLYISQSLTTDKVILLVSVRQRDQGITL